MQINSSKDLLLRSPLLAKAFAPPAGHSNSRCVPNMIDCPSNPSAILSQLLSTRRSVRDFLPQDIPETLLNKVLEDANWAPSWSNTQPYRIAIASGAVRARISSELCTLYDLGMAAQNGGVLAKLRIFMTRVDCLMVTFPRNFPIRMICNLSAVPQEPDCTKCLELGAKISTHETCRCGEILNFSVHRLSSFCLHTRDCTSFPFWTQAYS